MKEILPAIHNIQTYHLFSNLTKTEIRQKILDEILKISKCEFGYMDRGYMKDSKYEKQVLSALSSSVIEAATPEFLKMFPLDKSNLEQYQFTLEDPNIPYNVAYFSEKIHEKYPERKFKMIAFSSVTNLSDEAIKLFDEVLTKPIKMDDLYKLCTNIIEKQEDG